MIRIGAIAASLKQKSDRGKKIPRKRSPSEEEVENLKTQPHTEFADIDIRENSNERLRFRKLPWVEFAFTMMFWGGAIAIIAFLYTYRDHMKEEL